MIFQTFYPSSPLKPYVHHYDYMEIPAGTVCNVIPHTFLVMGLYSNGFGTKKTTSGFKALRSEFFGLQDMPRRFYSPNAARLVTIHFRDLCVRHFLNVPVHEAFNTELSLFDCCKRQTLDDLEEQFLEAGSVQEAIRRVDEFLLCRLKPSEPDPVVGHALRLIRQFSGSISMTTLADKVNSSQSLLEKRFRKALGTSPKRFSSLVRFNSVIYDSHQTLPMTERAYRAGYFDQAHFNRDFKLFTGEAPRQLLKNMAPLGEFRIFDLKTMPSSS